MCGIFGIFYGADSSLGAKTIEGHLCSLFKLAESRGREAAGIAITNSGSTLVYKEANSASKMISGKAYKQKVKKHLEESSGFLSVLGHARLVTNGFHAIDMNNQPLLREDLIIIHNGIVVNDKLLWESCEGRQPETDVDSEVLAAMFATCIQKGMSYEKAVNFIMDNVQGEATFAIQVVGHDKVILASNTGSLYLLVDETKNICVFVSELHQLKLFADMHLGGMENLDVSRVTKDSPVLVDIDCAAAMSLSEYFRYIPEKVPNVGRTTKILDDSYLQLITRRKEFKRCSKCVLPETMPFISFDEQGVCNYCRNYQPIQRRGEAELLRRIESSKTKSSDVDCLVAFSGGRDSCYGLHLLKKEYGLNPVTFTYDWGVVTPLARRNQARMCGELGVEHIWVSADINKKRDNIRKNLLAWLKQPSIGMIPLLMAGDKQFFYYANKVADQLGTKSIIFSTNQMEKTDFKSGFAGIKPVDGENRYYHLKFWDKLALAAYFTGNFMKNPRYLNSSLTDTAFAYLSYYFMEGDYTHLFEYLPWKESEVEDVLINNYSWELATDTARTWRIGDGTAPFYNYVYHSVAGFSEFDTFRSNQIREGQISREQALALLEEDNLPRWDSMREYFQMVNVDFESAIKSVDSIAKRY